MFKAGEKLWENAKEGKNIGYVTDRGTPLISDPGNVIVDEAIKQLRKLNNEFIWAHFF